MDPQAHNVIAQHPSKLSNKPLFFIHLGEVFAFLVDMQRTGCKDRNAAQVKEHTLFTNRSLA